MKFIQTSFNYGELSDRLTGRVDLSDKYKSGLEVCQNAIVKPYGAVAKRSGFKFIAEAKHADKECRLIEFEFNAEQTYILEFGHQYIRFYMDGGQIESGGSPYEISTTYTEDELFDIKFFGVSDILFITHVNHPPAKLTRSGHTSWSLSNISFTSQPAEWVVGGYPTCGTFHEERTVWAGVPSDPGKIWFSKTNDPYNMTMGANADDALSYDLRVDPIKWIASSRRLVIGTASGEWWLAGDAGGAAIEPTIVQSKQDSSNGCYNLAPVNIGANHVFVQRPGKVLRSLGYNFESDGYKGIDLSVLAEHLTRQSAIKDMAYQQYPDSIIWMVLENGDLIGSTYSEEHKVIGWHKHPTRLTDFYESVACIKGDTYDEVWISVKRLVDGAYKRTIEQAQNDDWSYIYKNTVYEGFIQGVTEDTVLLVQSDTTNNSQSFVDSGANAHTINFTPITFNNRIYPRHTDVFYEHRSYPDGSPDSGYGDEMGPPPVLPKFGKTSMVFNYSYGVNNTETRITSQLSDFDITRGKFTVDFWFLCDSTLPIIGTNLKYPMMGVWNETPSHTEQNWLIKYHSQYGGFSIRFQAYDIGVLDDAFLGYIQVDLATYNQQWIHVAFVSDGVNNLYCFFNGVLQNTISITGDIPATTHQGNFYLGSVENNTTYDGVGHAHFDEIRIRKDIAVWTSNFTPPTAPIQATDTWDSITTTLTKISDDAFYVDSGLKYKDEQNITGITSASPPVVTIVGHGWASGAVVHIRNVLGCTAINNTSFTIANVTANTFELSGIDGSDWANYISGGIAQREATTVTGLDHLDGEEVAIFANGKAYPNKKVMNGSVSISEPAPVISVGLPIETRIKTLRLSTLAGESTIQTKMKRIVKITPRLFDSLDGEIGEDEDSLIPLAYDDTTSELFTGDKELFCDGTYNSDAQVLIKHDKPTPFTLLALTTDVDLEDD